MMHRTTILILFCSTPFTAVATAQLPKLLTSEFLVTLEDFATGLDVAEIRFNDEQNVYYGPTNVVPFPEGSGRRIITTFGGTMRLMHADGQVDANPFLELESRNEHFLPGAASGLTTISFHPEFASVGSPGFAKFYTIEPEEPDASNNVDFVESVRPGNHHQEVVYEYTMEDIGSNSFSGTQRELLRIQQPGWHHNMADLLFGPDGLLYIGSGDGNNAPNATQNTVISDNSVLLTNIFGKILRINPFGSNSQNGKYGIPADNPFVDGEGENVDEIYAYGIRNPYRMAFDSETGDLYASETGQLKIESINRIQKGGNHGWNLKEGSFLYDKFDQENIMPDVDRNNNGIGDVAEANNLIDPIFEYDRDDGTAVIGGFLYRGNDMPQLRGKYLFADHLGALFAGDPENGEVIRLSIDPEGMPIQARVFGIAEDVDGSAVVYGMNGTKADALGVIYKLSTLTGDFDNNRQLDALDVNSLMAEIRTDHPMDEWFDLDGNSVVDLDDLRIWVKDIKGTAFGDANLDGVFNSRDLVDIFVHAEYEDGELQNSRWESGDWNADGEFSSSDLILAFQEDVYEQTAIPQSVVPEPTDVCLFFTVFALILARKRHP